MDIKSYLKQKREIIDKRLEELLPPEAEHPSIIHKSMRYSIFAGGKRLRPILALASCQAVEGQQESALSPACALELIHTYSLIHDDLPAMDNDDLRRGKPTSHKVFGEGIAILTGDALLTMAFQLLSQTLLNHPANSRGLQIIYEIAQAIGSKGLIGGQVMDLLSEGKEIDAESISYIHNAKTAALITASIKLGGLLGNASNEDLNRLVLYGKKVGLAFQIIDDILDIEGDSKHLGKTIGKDQKSSKATYPGVIGLEGSKKKASALINEAIKEINPLGEAALPLIEIAHFILNRQN